MYQEGYDKAVDGGFAIPYWERVIEIVKCDQILELWHVQAQYWAKRTWSKQFAAIHEVRIFWMVLSPGQNRNN